MSEELETAQPLEQNIEQQDNDENVDQIDDPISKEENTNDEQQEEMVVSIGDEEPEEEDDASVSESIRELRKNYRELQKDKRKLEEQLKLNKAASEKNELKLSKKPTLEDFDYDAEQYESSMEAWYEQKRKFEEQENKKRQLEREAAEQWEKKLQAYGLAKASLKARDFDDAEYVAQETLSPTQQAIILQGSENPALVVYALGKNPKKAKELAAINDPVKYAFAISKLENQLKITNRQAPPPEKRISGSTVSVSGSIDSNLEKLRAEAERTGDYTKVILYKNSKKKKA